MRDEFPDDVSGAAVGFIFSGHDSQRKWATEWDTAYLRSDSYPSSWYQPLIFCTFNNEKHQLPVPARSPYKKKKKKNELPHKELEAAQQKAQLNTEKKKQLRAKKKKPSRTQEAKRGIFHDKCPAL